LNPRRDAGRIDLLLGRAVERYGFRGLKVHGFDAMPTREVLEALRRYRVPMLVDVVNRIGRVELFATQYPDVPIIIPHLGGFADNWTVQTHLIDLLCRLPNVYADTSGVRYWDVLATAVKRAGPRKILFGSDGPQLHPALELCKIKLLRLKPAEERLITGGNILRLLRLAHGPDDRRMGQELFSKETRALV
jgi:predicted TIM-barrel fold metal-dependent hydrolase